MAFSLFSKKESTEHDFQSKPSSSSLAVRTMQNDLENIKNGERKSLLPEEGEDYKSAAPTFGLGSSPLAINPFSEEGEKLFVARDQSANAQAPQETFPNTSQGNGNPFGVTPPPAEKPPVTYTPTQSMRKNGLNSLIPAGGLLTSHGTSNKKKLISLCIFGVALLLFLAGGVWYYLLNNKEADLESVTEKKSGSEAAEPEKNFPAKQSPYSLDKPNYLSINTELIAPADFQKTLIQAGDRIKAADVKEPIEFLITDQNNNPLAFSRFAFLLKIELDPQLLALAGESFSLYVFNDAGKARLGLSLSFADAQMAASILAKTEAGLPYALRTLILEPNVAVAKTLNFRSTAYNQFSIRFANIDSAQNLSLDYSLDNGKLFIGMSKNALRAILDANTK